MAIFNSYVSLPEGIETIRAGHALCLSLSWLVLGLEKMPIRLVLLGVCEWMTRYEKMVAMMTGGKHGKLREHMEKLRKTVFNVIYIIITIIIYI
jgi:hypothetical protein